MADTQTEVLDIFTRTRALLRGHFVLRSGLHSGHYFQCAQVCQYMPEVERLAELGIPARIFLPNLDDRKSDFTDHMDAGGTVATLVEITVDDARAIVAAAEADKLVHGRTGIAVCLKEATAQLEQSQQDRATSEQHAEAWAHGSRLAA